MVSLAFLVEDSARLPNCQAVLDASAPLKNTRPLRRTRQSRSRTMWNGVPHLLCGCPWNFGIRSSRAVQSIPGPLQDVQIIRPDLTDDQAWKVLQAADKWHDCGVGLNWEVLEAVAESLFPEPED